MGFQIHKNKQTWEWPAGPAAVYPQAMELGVCRFLRGMLMGLKHLLLSDFHLT